VSGRALIDLRKLGAPDVVPDGPGVARRRMECVRSRSRGLCRRYPRGRVWLRRCGRAAPGAGGSLGPGLAVPILTVAQLVGNGSRVWFNRRAVDYRVVGWFALGGIPLAVGGRILFATAPLHVLTRAIGAFLVLIVLWRRRRPGVTWRPCLKSFAGIGAVSSLLSAMVGSVWPCERGLHRHRGLRDRSHAPRQARRVSPGGRAAQRGNRGRPRAGPRMIAGSWLGHPHRRPDA
jgi:hypothetical protein